MFIGSREPPVLTRRKDEITFILFAIFPHDCLFRACYNDAYGVYPS